MNQRNYNFVNLGLIACTNFREEHEVLEDKEDKESELTT